MAKQTLPVNFKDDILASSMGGKRRYNLIQNDDGTYSLEDVTDYTQTGSDFGAGQINATNKAVNESCDKANVIDDLNDIEANQADGMIAGAKAVANLIGNIYSKKVLWSHAGMFLNAGQSINLSEKISDQKRGVVLVLSRYESGASQDYGYCTYFVPKECLGFGADNPAFDIPLVKYSGGSIVTGSKYIYVSDNRIDGAATNGTSPNSGWVFRYVIGV